MYEMIAITFLTASLFFSFLSLFNSDFNSNISPFLVVVKYLLSVILSFFFFHLKNFPENYFITLKIEHKYDAENIQAETQIKLLFYRNSGGRYNTNAICYHTKDTDNNYN